MPEPIIFYDIPRQIAIPGDYAWNPNCWKTRYTLNFKGIPYKTVWVEYPDIKALCEKIGASDTEKQADGSPYYTLPVIYDPNTKSTISDSAVIVRYLDKTYPDTPVLIPPETDALHAAFASAFLQTLFDGGHTAALLMPQSHAVLNPASQDYFRETREAVLGKLEELAPAGSEKRERHWSGLRGIWHTFAEWLEADGRKDKLFFLGDKISYADITIAAFTTWIKKVYGEESKEWTDLLTWDGGRWARFIEAFKKYEVADAGSNVEL